MPHHVAQHSTNNSNTTPSGASRPFRQRVLYNQEQLLQLEAWYRQDRYPSGALMHEYADTLAAMVPNTPGKVFDSSPEFFVFSFGHITNFCYVSFRKHWCTTHETKC